jgi:hypothetical protein
MKIGFVGLFGIVSVGFVGACSSATEPVLPELPVPKFTCTSNSATMRLPAELRETLPALGPRQPDDAYVAISRSVPGGFAGLFKEGNLWVLTFVDPVAAEASRTAIQQAFAGRTGVPTFLDVANAKFRSAQWTFAELDEWYRYIVWDEAIFLHGAYTSDIDERANTIDFSVVDEAARAKVEARLATLGVSCNLVTTTIRPRGTLAG